MLLPFDMLQRFDSRSWALLLTSAIKVANPSYVRRNRTEERLADTKEILKQWITHQHSIRTIVFCDNSGYPLDELQRLEERLRPHTKRIEFLSYRLRKEDYGTRGYGWGEAHIYNYAMQHSRLLPHSTHLAFCSGRKYVRNVDRICSVLPPDFDFVADWEHNLAWLAADFYLVRSDIFRTYFQSQLLELIDDSKRLYFERVLAKVMLSLMARDYRWYPMPYHPLYAGVSGARNRVISKRLWTGNLVVNAFGSWISRWHYRLSRIVYDNHTQHVLDKLGVSREDHVIKK